MRKDITLRLTLVYIIPETAREQGTADVNAALETGAHQTVESGQMIGNVVVEVD